MESFKIWLLSPDYETLKMNRTEFKVFFGKVNEKEGVYKLQFKLKLPDQIYNFLVGKKVDESFKQKYDFSKKTFKKTISADSLQALSTYTQRVLECYKRLLDAQKEKKAKKIFVLFESKKESKKSRWNGVLLGDAQVSSLNYFVGYKGKDCLYDLKTRRINSGYDQDCYEAIQIEWTEERELFFKVMSDRLQEVNNNIKSFIESISDNNIDQLIEGGVLRALPFKSSAITKQQNNKQ